MDIVKERSGDVLNVRVSGRLDNHWSEPFDEAIEEMIRDGAHHLRVDLTGVNYLSSAGVGVLMKAYRDTTALHGSFRIEAASERVRTVLRLVELESLLFGTEGEKDVAPGTIAGGPRRIQSERALFECRALGDTVSTWTAVGAPERLTHEGFSAEHAASVAATHDLFAVGVGALGQSWDECRGLFGELVAAGGTAAFMPTDGTSTPDYMAASGELVPELQLLYALTFRGAPAHLLRFESSVPANPVALSEIAGVCARVAKTPHFGVVMSVEVSGLVGAGLRRSPAIAGAARFDFPAVREWLAFTPEREYARSSALVVGVATTSPSIAMRPFVRPLGGELHGHFHAAVTAFRSLPRGRVNLSDVLAQSFQPRSVVSVVHLLQDDRPIEGAGESEFLRGACWLFPFASDAGGAP